MHGYAVPLLRRDDLADGTVTRLVSRVGVDLSIDPDIAVLATLCA
ncbi:MAG: hypothetical protein ACKOFP_10830 [Actinomycetota bacterium]